MLKILRTEMCTLKTMQITILMLSNAYKYMLLLMFHMYQAVMIYK